MIAESLVEASALALAGLLVAALALLVGHGAWRAASERRWRRPVANARAAMAEVADRLELSPGNEAALRRLPSGRLLDLFAALVPSLAGAPREALAEAARALGVIDLAERWCRARSWRRRVRGARLLTLLGGGEAVMPALLADPRVEVRAQAAEWAADHPDPAVAATLVAMLTDPRGLARFTVMDSLIRLGPAVHEPLAAAIAGRAGAGDGARVGGGDGARVGGADGAPVGGADEARERGADDARDGGVVAAALEVGAAIADPRLAGAALARLDDGDPVIRARAVALLAAIGGAEHAAAVVGRLEDEAEEVRAAAAIAVGRLGHSQAAPALAARLADPSWLVRRNAALALRGLGASGELLLRRALRADDRFARDMARQTLDLPEATLPA
jgi:HEAT repeat protein